MSAQENKQIALTVIEALNSRDLSLWSQLLAEDYKAEHPGVSVPMNKTKSVGYYQRFVHPPDPAKNEGVWRVAYRG
jgi:hypothetical protein